jgi:hypothetical protein
MDPTIIDSVAYQEEADNTDRQPTNISNELITEIQLLIKRLRACNPIKHANE